MSIDAVAAQLRQAVACLPLTLLAQATTFFDEARATFAEASQGSSRTEPGEAIHGLSQTIAEVAELHKSTAQVKALIEQYLAHIAGGDQSTKPPAFRLPPTTHSVPRTSQTTDRDLVAEVQRQGKKISPEKVVRIGKDRAGRVVWLEEGDDKAGLAHLMDPIRVADFANKGVTSEDVVDLVFTALAKGEPVGTSGRDRIVYAIAYRGQPKRVAITVAGNGYIIGAHPVGLTKRIKPLR
ncbi:hypothetical protein ACTG9Q_06455 [Actinokineospora sp. 24-640]